MHCTEDPVGEPGSRVQKGGEKCIGCLVDGGLEAFSVGWRWIGRWIGSDPIAASRQDQRHRGPQAPEGDLPEVGIGGSRWEEGGEKERI